MKKPCKAGPHEADVPAMQRKPLGNTGQPSSTPPPPDATESAPPAHTMTPARFSHRPAASLAALGAALLLVRGWAAPADFKVEAPADGTVFQLSNAKGKYVALHFLLKTECPICLRYTRTLAQQAAMLPDVVQVFLKPDSADDIKAWTAHLGEDAGKSVVIYRDADAKLAREYAIPDGYKFHGQTVHYPALVLLDPAGKEVFRYVGKDNSDRFGFDQLKAKIAELKAQAAAQ